MPKFNVSLSRTLYQTILVEVEAENESTASEQAKTEVTSITNADWETDHSAAADNSIQLDYAYEIED